MVFLYPFNKYPCNKYPCNKYLCNKYLCNKYLCNIYLCSKFPFNKYPSNKPTNKPLAVRSHSVRQHGYSLLELLVTSSILITLMTLAHPSFATMIENSKIRAASFKIHQTLALARSAALTHAKVVLVCQLTSLEGTECVKSHERNTNWEYGWLVYVDENRNNDFDQSDFVLQTFALPTQTAVVFNQKGRLRFFPDGSARSAGFYICTKNSMHANHLRLFYSGRARTSKSKEKKVMSTCQSTLK